MAFSHPTPSCARRCCRQSPSQPEPPEPPAQAAPPAECEAACAEVVEIVVRRRACQPSGRNCKRPEILQPTRFRRPGGQGRGARLRQRFSESRFGATLLGKTRSRSPRMKLVWAAIDPEQAAAEAKHRISGCSGASPGAFKRKKVRLNFLSSAVPRCLRIHP